MENVNVDLLHTHVIKWQCFLCFPGIPYT